MWPEQVPKTLWVCFILCKEGDDGLSAIGHDSDIGSYSVPEKFAFLFSNSGANPDQTLVKQVTLLS